MGDRLRLPVIHYSTYIAAPPNKVFDMLTTASGWDAWFTTGAEVDARPSGSILFRWENFKGAGLTTMDGGGVLEVIPSRRFVFQWTPGESTTTVEFDLEPRGAGTQVSVRESGYTATDHDLEALVDCAAGWGEALTLLKVYLEHGITYGPVPD
ncbi:SRPBCC domain-containing protein [Chloroflexota bacterium]